MEIVPTYDTYGIDHTLLIFYQHFIPNGMKRPIYSVHYRVSSAIPTELMQMLIVLLGMTAKKHRTFNSVPYSTS